MSEGPRGTQGRPPGRPASRIPHRSTTEASGIEALGVRGGSLPEALGVPLRVIKHLGISTVWH